MTQSPDQTDKTIESDLDSLFRPRQAEEADAAGAQQPADDETRTDDTRTVLADHNTEPIDDIDDETDEALEIPRRSRVTLGLLLALLLFVGILLGALLAHALAPTPTPTTVYVLNTPAPTSTSSPSGATTPN